MQNKRTKQILIRVSERELNNINRNARAARRKKSAYIREVAENLMVVNYTCDAIYDHKQTILSLNNAVQRMIYTILKTGEYVPPDLDYIADKMREILDAENQLLTIINDDREKTRKEFRRIVRRNIREVLKNEGDEEIE